MTAAVSVKRLRQKDWRLWWKIRLGMTRLHPRAIGPSYAEESKHRPQDFRNDGAGHALFGAFMGQTLVGVIGLARQAQAKRANRPQRHCAVFMGNDASLRLFSKHGLKQYAVDPRLIKPGKELIDGRLLCPDLADNLASAAQDARPRRARLNRETPRKPG